LQGFLEEAKVGAAGDWADTRRAYPQNKTAGVTAGG